MKLDLIWFRFVDGFLSPYFSARCLCCLTFFLLLGISLQLIWWLLVLHHQGNLAFFFVFFLEQSWNNYMKEDLHSYRRNFRNCKICIYNCDDLLSSNCSPRSCHMFFSYIHNLKVKTILYSARRDTHQ